VYLPTSTSVARFDDGFLYNNRTSLQVFQSLDYLPFGELNSADSGISTHKFTGDEHDSETNLEHTQFRKYSSALGRWLSPDPAGIGAVDPRNPQSWNRYSYVLNNPLKFVDPRGLYCEFFDDSGNNVESIDAYSSPDECGSNGGTWVDDNTTVLVNANDPNNPDSLGGPGSGLPPAGCSFFYQNGTLDGTLCGNQFSPAELPLTSQDYLVAIHNQLSKLPTVCGGVGIFGSAEIGGFGGFAQVDQNGNASATSLIPVAPGITNNVQSSGNGPLLFYGEGAGVLYEPDLGNYGAPAAVGGYLGFSIPGTKTEAAIGAYVENPSIAGAYSCPP
jgi:RHS repeat-associated protein